MTACLLAASSGCESKQVDVTAGKGGSYGRSELEAAVARYSTGAHEPARYRELTGAIAAIAPRFDEEVKADAERYQLFLALPILEDYFARPFDEQENSLATTVWPLLFNVDPGPDETAGSYIEGICVGALGTRCKHVVAEHRPVILAAEVWLRLLDRAREALASCRSCRDDPSYARSLARIESHELEVRARALQVEERAHPRNWPVAGDSAEPWSGAALLAIDSEGKATLAGETVPAGGVPRALVELRGKLRAARRASASVDGGSSAAVHDDVLGLYLLPTARVHDVRGVLSAAGAAGFDIVALEARAAPYPYPLRQYRLAAGKRGVRVRVREVETVQVMVQVLDAAWAEVPGGHGRQEDRPPLRIF